MDFVNIVNKFGYSEEFSKVLKQIYDQLIVIFKNEQLVYEALLNTKIVNVNNVYNYLRDNELLESDETLVTESDLKRSSGVYHSVPEITFSDGKYEIKSVKRVVAVVNLDLSNTSSKATLAHELSHLIKSYYNEYTIENNILTANSGFITSTYELSHDGEKVTKKLLKEAGVGLEEGLTSVQEELITRNAFDIGYKSSGYGAVNGIAGNFLELTDMYDVIINAEIYHDKSELFKRIKLEEYTVLEEVADRIYKLGLEMFASAMDYDKMLEIAEEMKKIIREEYAPLRNSMANNLNRS